MKTNKRAYPSKPVYLVDGCRTPFLKAGPPLERFSASDMSVACSRKLLLRNNVPVEDIDEVIVGCVMPGPNEANIARIIGLRLGCDEHTTAWTVQRNCASGLQAIDNAAQSISHGRADIVLAGGTESMSMAPVLLNHAMVSWLNHWNYARGFGNKVKTMVSLRPSFLKPVIGLLCGLTDPIVNLSMGQTAENLAHRFDISREEMDTFALHSHQRLAEAYDNDRMSEVETLYSAKGKFFSVDNGLRRDSSVEKLARLKPAFDKKFGKVSAGNSAQITDGAASLLLVSENAVNKYGLKPIARIIDSQWAGLDPAQMGLGPVHAMTPLMQRHKLSIDDVDYWEINEAFAAQVLACIKAWEDDNYCQTELGLKQSMGSIPIEKLNVDGGSVSIGHPVGASGARILLHLANTLKQNKAKRGIASLCIGGGQGGAMLIENMETASDE